MWISQADIVDRECERAFDNFGFWWYNGYIEFEEDRVVVEIDERILPAIIQEDIKKLKAYYKGEIQATWEALWYHLSSVINASQHGNEITEEVADYLRTKYLGQGDIKDFYFNNTKTSIYV